MSLVTCTCCKGTATVRSFRGEDIPCDLCSATGQRVDPIITENHRLRAQCAALERILEQYRDADRVRDALTIRSGGFAPWGDE